MHTITSKSARVRPIGGRLAHIARAGAELLGSLTGRQVRVEIDRFSVRTGEDLLGRIAQPMLLLRHRLTGNRGSIGYLLARKDAIALACMTRPGCGGDEYARRRRASVLDRSDLEALQDVGWLFADRGDRVLRQMTADRVGLEFEEITAMTPENCERLVPPTREHGVLRLRIALEDLPPAEVAVVVDPRSYDLLDADDPVDRAIASAGGADDGTAGERSTECTIVHTFLEDEETIELVRRCCRKLGTDIRRHAGSDAPNPSAIRDGVVVIDVPTGSTHRFDWCRRLKQASPNVRVAVLVHKPTRSRVLQAFEARADLVVAWPTDLLELAVRLRKLLRS